MSDNPFTRHPHEVGESYGEHMGRAAASGLKLIGCGIACLVHALFPFLFEHSASERVRELHGEWRGRSTSRIGSGTRSSEGGGVRRPRQ